MSDFKPLDMQRAIRADSALSKTDKPFLWAAVLRTDNKTRKVRASLEVLARDAGWHPNTAYKTFRDDNQAVMRYFEKVERTGRSVQLWFHPAIETTPEEDSQGNKSPQDEDSSAAEDVTPETRTRREGSQTTPEVESGHIGSGPSAIHCPLSVSTPRLLRPSLLAGNNEDVDSESPGEFLLGETSVVDAKLAEAIAGPSVFDMARLRMQAEAAPAR